MSSPILTLLAEATEEVARARQLFPNANHLTTAFAEEAGEVIKAVMDHMQKGSPRADVRKEIVQAIAMAIRLETEGDPVHRLGGVTEPVTTIKIQRPTQAEIAEAYGMNRGPQ